MGFRIPAGGLTVSIGANGIPEAAISRVEVSLDFWDHWLEIARSHSIEAVILHRQLLSAHTEGHEDTVGDLLGKSMRTSMTCIGALGFSLDSLYASVKERFPKTVHDTIGSEKTLRHQYVHETLRRASRLSNNEAKFARSVINQIFRFRGRAVHPPGGWAEPVIYPELGKAVAAGYVAFSAMNAASGYVATRKLVQTMLSNARPGYSELAEWARGALDRLPDQLPPEIAIVRESGESGGTASTEGPAST